MKKAETNISCTTRPQTLFSRLGYTPQPLCRYGQQVLCVTPHLCYFLNRRWWSFVLSKFVCLWYLGAVVSVSRRQYFGSDTSRTAVSRPPRWCRSSSVRLGTSWSLVWILVRRWESARSKMEEWKVIPGVLDHEWLWKIKNRQNNMTIRFRQTPVRYRPKHR